MGTSTGTEWEYEYGYTVDGIRDNRKFHTAAVWCILWSIPLPDLRGFYGTCPRHAGTTDLLPVEGCGTL